MHELSVHRLGLGGEAHVGSEEARERCGGRRARSTSHVSMSTSAYHAWALWMLGQVAADARLPTSMDVCAGSGGREEMLVRYVEKVTAWITAREVSP